MEDDQQCPDCEQMPNIYRYYLPLKDKIKRWCSSDEMCHEMLAHWKMRDVWLNKSGTSYPVNEIWDGSRFKELQWFWNPDSRCSLPHTCSSCGSINSMKGISVSDPINLVCHKCGFEEKIYPNIVNGDPRNIALIGHWDGWQLSLIHI